MSLQLHRPDGEGGLEPRPDARPELAHPAAIAALGQGRRGDRLPKLENPEMNPTSTFRSVLFWLASALVTFVLLVVGYGTGFWHLIPPGTPPA